MHNKTIVILGLKLAGVVLSYFLAFFSPNQVDRLLVDDFSVFFRAYHFQ